MHDLDQIRLELEGEPALAAYDDTTASAEFEGYEESGDFEVTDGDGADGDLQEMELATELLGVGSDEELDLFLGKLFKKASRFVGGAGRHALGSLLKRVARKALPIAGTAVGTFFGGPAGAAVGNRLASGAGQMFGLELEGLSPEDQEYEVARSFVRLATDAARTLGGLASDGGDPVSAARTALVGAAQRYAPGLLQAAGNAVASGVRLPGLGAATGARSGRWERVGNTIILRGI